MNEQSKPQPQTQEQHFDAIAAKAGKTTIMKEAPNGGVFVWVTTREADPLTALMSIALAIMVKRGHNPDSASGVTIRRVTDVVAPGCNVFWQVTDESTQVIASGYAVDEQEAAEKIAAYIKPNIKLPTAADLQGPV